MTRTTAVSTVATPERAGLLATFGARYNVDAAKVATVLKQTCFRTEKPASDEQMMALLVVANQYQLNPFTKEIFAFEDKHKGIVPVVSVDGWTRIINSHPQIEALEFEYGEDDESGPWVECIITRKDRAKPMRVREYLNECRRETGPWKSHPRRMLRHKALIQAARIAFGFGGIYDQDEADRIREVDVTPPRTMKPQTAAPRAKPAPTDAEIVDTATGEITQTEPTQEELRAADTEIAEAEANG
jgi:phage recombination protein Bet